MSQGIIETDKLTDLEACYDYCRSVTHRHGPNFSVGFRFLPLAKRNAVYAVYAFCRFADDMADEVGKGDPVQLLDSWEESLERCYTGVADHPILVALAHSAQIFDIPAEPFHRLIDGCRTDLVKVRYETFDELLDYCEHVATTISELSLSIFGWSDPRTPELGRNLSTALQLTNIIRDVAEDFGRGRIYLPLEDLRHFGVHESDLDGSGPRDRFRSLMDFQVKRALGYFDGARGIVGVVEPDSRLAVALMGGVYNEIARRIERDVEAVLSKRVALSTGEKVRLAARMFGWNWTHRVGLASPPVW